MDIELTPAEAGQFQAALLSAFPNRGDLEQLVYFNLGQDLDQIIPAGSYANDVTNLIKWAIAQGQAGALLEAAHDRVPGNPKLHTFYQLKAGADGGPEGSGGSTKPLPRALTPELRRHLVDAVMAIPASGTYDGRSAYLLGLPASPSRNNDPRTDLNTIFSQLDGMGRLASGEWPLSLVIDNILPYVQGWPAIRDMICSVRQALEDAYSTQ